MCQNLCYMYIWSESVTPLCIFTEHVPCKIICKEIICQLFQLFIFIFQWESNPVNDMFADAVLTALLKTGGRASTKKSLYSIWTIYFGIILWSKLTTVSYNSGRLTVDRAHFSECLREMLGEMFGTDTVTETIRSEKLDLVVNDKSVVIDLATLVRNNSNSSNLSIFMKKSVRPLLVCRTSRVRRMTDSRAWSTQLLKTFTELLHLSKCD